jgi:non-homologous end joining protein Ku
MGFAAGRPQAQGRGYEVAKGQYLIVEDGELEAIKVESTRRRAYRPA